MGVKKGDRVGMYLPMIPELPISMLACAKLGAIHVVVFSGFSAGAVRDRLEDCQPKVLVTCDGSYRRGKPLATKPQADEAIAGLDCIQKVVVVKRNCMETAMQEGRDVWWDEFVAGQPAACETVPMESADPLFILYTAGAGGKPRGIVHTHAGTCIGPAFTYIMGIRYQGYRCLLVHSRYRMDHRTQLHRLRATLPGSDKHHVRGLARLSGLRPVVFDHRGVWSLSDLYRAHGDQDVHERGARVASEVRPSTVRLMGSVGEAMNPMPLSGGGNMWGVGSAPIMDTWFQSETCAQVIAPLPITPLKPGSPSFPCPDTMWR